MPNNHFHARPATYDHEEGLLDGVNLRILAELRDGPRLSMAELARRVSMSAPAVTERVQRLQQAGVIAGYRLDIDPAAVGLPVTAFARIRPMPGSLTKIAELAEQHGFHDPGRFANNYRAVYGESPSVTLRRRSLDARRSSPRVGHI